MKFFRTSEPGDLIDSTQAKVRSHEPEYRDFAPARRPQERDRDVVADNLGFLLQRVSGYSVETLDEVIVELKILRKTLQSEGARVEREVIEYATLSEAAMQSTRIISESLAHWRTATEIARISA